MASQVRDDVSVDSLGDVLVNQEDSVLEEHVSRTALPVLEAKAFHWDPKALTPERIRAIQDTSQMKSSLARVIAAQGISAVNSDPEITKEHLGTKYSIEVGDPTDQEGSGRCWIFAALNMLRIDLRGSLGKDFEFSESHVAFWDKFERCNIFLEKVIEMRGLSVGDQRFQHLLSEGFGDGGEWEFFANVVEKYGLVPKEIMPETKFSKATKGPNTIIFNRLREWASIIHNYVGAAAGSPGEYETLESMKMTALGEMYNILVSYWGKPPTDFYWKNSDGVYQKQTPVEFYRERSIDLSEKIHLCNLPYLPYGTFLRKKDGENVVGGDPIRVFNVDIEGLKNALRASIKDGKAAWLECSMNMLDRDKDLLSTENYKVSEIFDFNPEYNVDKGQALLYHSSGVEHAMLVIGCDDEGINREEGETLGPLWKVENSWGAEQRFLFMTDSWFDKHCYGIVVDRKYLSEPVFAAVNEGNEVELAPWDPYG